jgi:hypothetical protein
MPARYVASVSEHSTRVGAAQDLAALDIDLAAITQAGGWRSPRMPLQYAEKINVGRSGICPRNKTHESSTEGHPFRGRKKLAIPRASSGTSRMRAMFQILMMKLFIRRPCGAKSPAEKPSRLFVSAALSGSERRWGASVRNPAESPCDAVDFETPVLTD